MTKGSGKVTKYTRRASDECKPDKRLLKSGRVSDGMGDLSLWLVTVRITADKCQTNAQMDRPAVIMGYRAEIKAVSMEGKEKIEKTI